jgi:hypothetical protein
MLKEKKVPTILGIIILIIGLAAGVFLVTQGQEIFLRASPELTPDQIKVTNISDNSLTLSWTTQKETSGFIKYGESPSLGQTLADDRDQLSGETGAFTTHYVTLVNLKPNTTYYYKIGSGGKVFPAQGQPYETQSAPVAQGLLPPSDVASGIVNKSDGAPAEGTIVYLSMANVSPLSVIVKSSGSWLIPLNTARTTDLDSFIEYDKEAQVIELFVEGGSLGHSSVITTTKNDNPVPVITLGETYDFRQYAEPAAVTPTPTISLVPSLTATPSGFNPGELLPTPSATPTGELSISNPEQGEDLNALKPEFAGTGPPGKLIEIVVESSSSYTGTIKVNDDGSWDWTPPADLEPGTHTVKISYGGQTISKTFTVLAAGESDLPAYTATPSATISPSPTLSPTPTTAPRTALPSTESGVPDSGFVTPTFFFFLLGSSLVTAGFLLQKKMLK